MTRKEFRNFIENETDYVYLYFSIYLLKIGDKEYKINLLDIIYFYKCDDDSREQYTYGTFIDKHNSGELYD